MSLVPTSAGSRDPGIVLETERLILRRFDLGDAEFILALVNEPSFIRYIGDKGVRTLEDARAYLLSGPIGSYQRMGFGLYLTLRKSDGVPIGMCGLLKRDTLPDVDIGFAFLPQFCRQGFALESAAAVVRYARTALGLSRLVAVTDPDNAASIRLLERLGLSFERLVRLSESGDELTLMTRDL
jgi:RimJ/RimL family protein N-acetyltransferase